jgi:hypothetical protein
MLTEALLFQFFGALVGVYLISRIFWVIAKGWPNSIDKAIALSIFCYLGVLALDILSWLSAGNDAYDTKRIFLFGAAQIAVLLIDIIFLKTKAVKSSPSSGN